MNKLEEKDRILSDTKTDFAANKLVLIAKKDADLPIHALEDPTADNAGGLAVGNPDSVPAGMYAKAALEAAGLWEELQDELIYAKDVRQVLTYVETGNTAFGFVYISDALRPDDVEVVTEVDPLLTEPVIYPAAVVAASDNKEAAAQFTSFLKRDAVQDMLKQYGFDGS